MLNDPVNFNDPNGKSWSATFQLGLIGAGVSMTQAIVMGETDPWKILMYGGIGFVEGLATGGVASIFKSSAIVMLRAGFLTGAFSNASTQYIHNDYDIDKMNWWQVASSGVNSSYWGFAGAMMEVAGFGGNLMISVFSSLWLDLKICVLTNSSIN